jgi:Sulfotransferase domain
VSGSGLGRVEEALTPYVGPMVRAFGAATSGVRAQPNLLIVGTQRGGTTSIYRALRQHPGFAGPFHRKGVHFFDVEFRRGMRWYVGHFPRRAALRRRERRLGHPVIVGEASPYYMAHPCAPERFAELLPGVRVVALLREPMERAYSAYTHETARGFEHRSFVEALHDEASWIDEEIARSRSDPAYESHRLRHNAYLFRGHYVDQLRELERVLGRERILVMDSDRYFADPEREFARLLGFVGLPAVPDIRHDQHNARPRIPLDDQVRRELGEHFAPYDAALAEWLGWTPSWMDKVESSR